MDFPPFVHDTSDTSDDEALKVLPECAPLIYLYFAPIQLRLLSLLNKLAHDRPLLHHMWIY
jgi:hypothetical protein